MVILDRVVCDRCGRPMGQLWNQPAPASDLLPKLFEHTCPGGCEQPLPAQVLEHAA